MQLFTKAQQDQLIKNGGDRSPNKDHPPVVRLFMTNTACTWLISELDPDDPDIGFGLCDLGMGYPELGYVSIGELYASQSPPRFRFLSRDTFFTGAYPLSVYARAAREHQQVVTYDTALRQAAPKLQP